MPPKKDQATIIILDIGRNVGIDTKVSFFQNAKTCVMRIIERKIISQPNSLMGILLLGSKKTMNNVAAQCSGGFKHIETLADLQQPTWQMIRDIPNEPSKSTGDWFDALIVAADLLRNIASMKISSKKIILITNFLSPTNVEDDDIQKVVDGFKEECIELDVIGPDINSEKKNEDMALAMHIVESTNGATATFDYVMSYLLFHKKKNVNAVPWNVDLSIGPNIKIPVSTYIRLRDEPIIKNWMKAVKDPVTGSASTEEGIVKNKVHVNTENQASVEPDNIIKGHLYGHEIIPFSSFDKSMLYEPGDKCLSIYGFTKSENIKWQNLNGDGLSYVFGRKGDDKAQRAIRCLVECLHELNLVGIARRVYNKGNAPKMFALMPVIDTNNFICLSMIGIIYKDDIKYMTFPSTTNKKFECTKLQVDAFKELIKAMNLTKAYEDTFDDSEAFPIAETVNPGAQYILDCIAYRALNPEKPLPPPRSDIMTLFKSPPLVEERSQEPLKLLKNLFDLKKIEPKRKFKKNDASTDALDKIDNMDVDITPKVELPHTDKSVVQKIGTIDPVNDFNEMSKTGKPISDIYLEMSLAIENLVYFNLDENYKKAVDAMTHFRTESLKIDPTYYNTWVTKFKTALFDRNKTKFLSLMNENNLDLILKMENQLSTHENISKESQLYFNDTIPDSTQIAIDTDVNDIFDEM